MGARPKFTALITGADHPTGLGTARALAGTGIEIIGICSNRNSACCQSRMWDRLITTTVDNKSFIEELLIIGKDMHERCVLFPIQDNVVQLISDHREVLQECYHFVLPEKSTLNLLLDKVAFHDWAEKEGLSVPKTHIVASHEELESVLNRIKYPVIIKPFVKTRQWELLSPTDKVFKLYRKEDLGSIDFDLFRASPKCLVQQWIPGGDGNVHYCLVYFDRNGHELAYYTGKKMLQWPVGCGNTVVAIGTKNQKVHYLTNKAFKRAGFSGLGSIEFKQSDLDKKYYIIEPTVGRNDLQSYVAVAGGINLTKIAFYDAINKNQILTNFRRRKGVWIEENSLLDALRYSGKKGDLQYKEFRQILNGKISFAYFKIKDPIPFIQLTKQKISRKIKRKFLD